MSMDGGGKTVQSVQSSEPWSAQQGPLKTVYTEAQNQYFSGKGQDIFGGNRVVPLSGQTEQALGQQEQRALAGSPLLQAAQANTQASLSGELNPALKAMLGQIQGAVRPGLDAQFASAGRYGSGLHQAALSDAIAQQAVPLAYTSYNTAMGAAAPLSQMDYADIGMLGQVGAAREQQAGAELQAQMQKFNEQNAAPVNALQRLAALISGGNVGGTTTSSQPIYQNPLMQMAGLGLGGASAFGQLAGAGGPFSEKGLFNKFFGI